MSPVLGKSWSEITSEFDENPVVPISSDRLIRSGDEALGSCNSSKYFRGKRASSSSNRTRTRSCFLLNVDTISTTSSFNSLILPNSDLWQKPNVHRARSPSAIFLVVQFIIRLWYFCVSFTFETDMI